MQIYVVRLNPDTRNCKPYSKYPTKNEYEKIHSESPMDGFHEAVNFLPESGIVRGYLPPRHSTSLRNGEPFCLITITAKTATSGGDQIIGIQAGCIYSDETQRLNLLKTKSAPDLLCHYFCAEDISLLFSSTLPNARNVVLGDEIQWIWGPVKQVTIDAFNRVLAQMDTIKLNENELLKLKNIEKIVNGELPGSDTGFLDESSFQNEVIKNYRKSKKPKGNPRPTLRTTHTYQYSRDPAVAAYALRHADGSCQKCGNDAPFISASTGLPYLEVHHIIPLKDGGADTVENVMALCPNCHKEVHYG